ncbi:MAG: YutD family protein [Acholeplasma sp.]|nr:YutD family protein [Acholeplasma sp.]
MKTVTIENNNYELIDDYKNGFEENVFKDKYTDYFDGYDYILGDWAYGKLRLKGFCERENPLFNKINDYNLIENYIKENCAYDCRYFILKRV